MSSEITTIGSPVSSMVIRGKVITDNLINISSRDGKYSFQTPDAHQYLDQLTLGNPGKLSDLYEISLNEIYDYLEELAEKLDYRTNERLRLACERSYQTAPVTPKLVDESYAVIPDLFRRDHVSSLVEQVGEEYLEGWVELPEKAGGITRVRCYGARTVHVVAGNSPLISAWTIIRNAFLRSDAIIKAPSNDPFTASAIAETMVEMAPDHPITKHLSVAYWRGGDEAFEKQLYQPHNVEKIIAWGGFASVKHVTQYIQPGLELVSLDPKSSGSIIGKDAFKDDETIRYVASRLARDVGGSNQVTCANARVVYVQSGTDEPGIENLRKLGEYLYEEILALPDTLSTAPKAYDPELKSHVEATQFDDDWYTVFGGDAGEGAVIVSHLSDPVSYSSKLADRTANLVPVDTIEQVMGAINAYTQTIGVYPESLKDEIIQTATLHGAQRFVTLGCAVSTEHVLGPHDGLEVSRRMGKWISNQVAASEVQNLAV